MELLLAITLFSILAVAIYSVLAAGIRVHKRGIKIGGGYSDLDLALRKITQDLQSSVCLNNTFIVEDSQKLFFYSVQSTSPGVREIYKITYTWEGEKDGYVLLRLKEAYIDSLQDEHPKGERLLEGIKRIDFDYGYLKKGFKGEEELEWRDDWKEEAMPKLIKLRIEIGDKKFSNVIYCPTGKMGEVKEG